ncbi:MAG: SusD/RagB family nutrient-binding outer membrane lipoprotein [Capnocytophaga sp.]|nr:SusD/RagB family nutrient-binding outer membrane lipoprotein [Capnocytophaga sp.]
MKKYISKIGTIAASLALFACSDFEDINVNPMAASVDQMEVEYFINGSIIGAQQDPDVAERAFVLYWKAAGHMDRINSLPVGVFSDDWTGAYYNQLSGWLTSINAAIQVADEKTASGSGRAYTDNLKQIARIWRVYLMSEGTDIFGPMPLNGFQGVNPSFDSVENVYLFMLDELKEAVNQLDTNLASVPENVAKHDPAYGYNFTKWTKYGNSLRMRLAMRIAEVAPTVAKTHFEEAVAGGYISELADDFEVQEKPGWDALTGVMTREWNNQYISTTINNLYVGLGGVESSVLLNGKAEALANIKADDWLGIRYENHFATKTNDPMAGYWFDGMPHSIDPRAYALFPIPGDLDNPEFNKYPSWSTNNVTDTKRRLIKEGSNDETLVELDGAFTWNAFAGGSWGAKGERNRVLGWQGMLPRLKNSLRNSTAKRLFYGAWESYFLIAEAAVKGWNVPLSAQAAYENGIKASFDYWGISAHYTAYIASQDYNRVGTSVSWSHTAEPSAKTVRFKNGYTNAEETVTYQYPANHLYQNGTVRNDALTKIITQKFLAQVPWLPLEGWSDHRRLGLPFFENPSVENPLPGIPSLNSTNYMEGKVEFMPQRVPYPSTLKTNSAEAYQTAIQALGGDDSVFTPLWWAKH